MATMIAYDFKSSPCLDEPDQDMTTTGQGLVGDVSAVAAAFVDASHRAAPPMMEQPEPSAAIHPEREREQLAASLCQEEAGKLANPVLRYTLHKELRQSIYGKIYFATDNATGKHVALKVSVRQLVNSHTSLHGTQVLENPVQEVAIMQQITSHPNIVSLEAVHEEPSLHWMSLEFVSGGELFDSLCASPDGVYTEDQARYAFLQLVEGMKHMHRCGVAHLDLSLENLLIHEDGTIKICDFGLARPVSRGQLLSNSSDMKPGKLGYMAPEILAGQDFDGTKADVFSAGVILFTLLTGHPPFECALPRDKLYSMIAKGKLAKLLQLTNLAPRVPAAAVDLLARLLSADPAQRPSAEQIAAHPWLTIGPAVHDPSDDSGSARLSRWMTR